MKKAVRIILKTLLGIVALLLAIAIALAITVNVTPRLGAHIIQNFMSGGNGPTEPADMQTYRDKVEVVKDVAYASAYKNSTMDIFYPKNATGKSYPVLFWAHGGAFVAGDKSGIEVWATILASHGYGVVSINYQLAPDAVYPAQVQQMSDAYTSLVQMQAQYPTLNINQVAFGGDSAGAHIASQFVAVQTNPTLAANLGLEAVVPANALKAAVLYCGPYNIQNFLKTQNILGRFFIWQLGWAYLGKRDWANAPVANYSSTVQQVTPQFPPAYITDGNNFSFEADGKALVQALQQQGVEIQSLFFGPEKNINHEYQFQMELPEAQECLTQTLAFLQQHMAA